MHSEDPVLAVDDEMKHTVREELRRFRPTRGVTSKGGKCMLIMKKTLWKNNLNFEKHAPKVRINLIIIAFTDSDKIIRDFTFTQPLVYIYVVALYGCEA